MKRKLIGLWSRMFHDQSGQSLILMALMMVALLGFSGFVVDFGHVYYSYHELQTSTDAAAMAGAEGLSTSGTQALTQAALYSAQSGDNNYHSNLTITKYTATLGCVTATVGASVACLATDSGTANAIQVTQTATVHSYFMGILGTPYVTISATSSALMRGAGGSPYNIAFVVDATESMTAADSNCGTTTTTSENTNGSSTSGNPYIVYAAYTSPSSGKTTSVSRFQCMEQGVQTFLSDVYPCAASGCGSVDSSGNYTSAMDKVSIFSFPEPESAAQAANDYNCAGDSSTPTPYTYPSATGTSYDPGTGATYQITPFMDNYQTTSGSASTSTGTLSTSTGSDVTLAEGVKSGCGMADTGGEGTYYAGAIYAATAALLAEQAAEKAEGIDAQSVMIITSDGAATSSSSQMSSTGLNKNGTGVYPSDIDECEQAVVAAQAATAAGIKVYTVAYGSGDTGCTTDTGAKGITSPCSTMQQMASNSTLFYSDNNESGVTSDCSSSNSFSDMPAIFSNIAGQLTDARLIPNSAWPSS